MKFEPTRRKSENWTSNQDNSMPCIMTGYVTAFLID